MWRFMYRPTWVDQIVRYLRTLNRKLDCIMATQAENQAQVDALAAQADKAHREILDQVAKLEEARDAGQELDFTGLRTAVGGLDDMNVDAVEPVAEAPVEDVPADEAPVEVAPVDEEGTPA